MINLDYEFSELPFPHIIIRNVIKDKYVHEFLRHNTEITEYMANMRNLERFQVFLNRGTESRWNIKLPSENFTDEFNRVTRDFLTTFKYHSGINELFKELFVPYYEKEFIDFDDQLRPKKLDISYGAYNACTEAKNIIGWHLDRGNKLIAGFIYLREKGDTVDDGHLQISSGPDSFIKEIPYEDNVLVAWPNLTNAWHRATVRYPTKHLRRIVNFIQETEKDRFYHDYETDKHDKNDKSSRSIHELHSIKMFGFKEVHLNEREESKATT